jgi:hypothetical protein
MTNITPDLEQHAVPIDDVKVHPGNYRRGNVEAIQESLTRFGQVRPVVVQLRTGFVVAGNHTLRAARALEWEKIAAVAVDLSDEDADAYLLADNRLSDIAENDDKALGELLERMMLAGQLGGTGWSPDAVDDHMAALDALPTGEPEETQATQHDSEAIANQFSGRANQEGPLRQFVLLYPPAQGEEVAEMVTRLSRAWGVDGAREVIAEALRRAVQDPPIEGLTDEEKAKADAPVEQDPITGDLPGDVKPRPVGDPQDPDGGFDDGPGGQQTQSAEVS